MLRDDQLNRFSEILADLAKGLFLTGFGPVFFGQRYSSLLILLSSFLAIFFTILSLKVLELKIYEYS